MKLGEIIREYRLNNKMSMGDFARVSGLSKPYVSMLESNKNSKGGGEINPSVDTITKVAQVVGLNIGEILKKMGDEKIDLRPLPFSDEEMVLLNGYRTLTPERKNLIKSMIFQLNSVAPVSKHGVVQNNAYGNNYSGITNVGVK